MFIDIANCTYLSALEFANLKLRFENELNHVVSNLPFVPPLSLALPYVLQSGGKRLRPSLAISMLLDCGGHIESFYPVAVSLELLHVASLVHDDLPALDNDTMRRGKNTCHIEFNEATAILAGDILVPIAVSTVNSSKYADGLKIKLSDLICHAYRNLCYGQQLDLLPANELRDQLSISKLKTGDLFAASMACGAVAAGASDKGVELVKEIGLHVGLCYQIYDDFADSSDSAALKGRSESSDMRNNKQTFSAPGKNRDAIGNFQKSTIRILECFTLLSSEFDKGLCFGNTKRLLNDIFSKMNSIKAA